MSTEVIPRILPVTFNLSHTQNTFEYYKLASVNATNSPNQNWFSCNGFFELNYYYTGLNFNGAGKVLQCK